MTARYRKNPGHRPSDIEDSDRIAVRFTYPDGTIREREADAIGLLDYALKQEGITPPWRNDDLLAGKW